jgi:acyl-CoA synthetase (AMP-forming)/AMP-acid ligase II
MTWSAQVGAAWRDRHDPAVVTAEVTWSGTDLLARAAGAAAWLDEVAAPPGLPVPALLTTSPDAFALLIGGAASRRPIAPLGPRHTASELAASVRSLGSELLLAGAEHAALAHEVGARTGVRIATVPELAPSRPLDADPSDDDVAFVLHTSGTSGAPKAVPYRQDRMRQRARVNAGLGSLGPASVFASASPLHHIAGWGNYAVALAAGSAVVPVTRFSVEAWKELAAHGTTNALLVPTMIDTLLEAGALDIGTLRYLHYGASPIHPDTLARVLATLPTVQLVNIYGQTEGSPITCLTPDDHRLAATGRPELLGSVGRAAPEVELRVEGPDGNGVGEVCARAFHLARADDDGWLRTGDLGRLDHDGYLFLVARKDDRIIRGGENVYPQEVEQVLAEHPGVRECAVVGVADARWGDVVHAFIVPTDPDAPPDVAALRAHARERLAGFKVPTAWTTVDALPRNPAGKVLRRQLIESLSSIG